MILTLEQPLIIAALENNEIFNKQLDEAIEAYESFKKDGNDAPASEEAEQTEN